MKNALLQPAVAAAVGPAAITIGLQNKYTTPNKQSYNIQFICAKHKSQPIFLCVSLACQKSTRLSCNKCLNDHRDHSNQLISIEYLLSRSEESAGAAYSKSSYSKSTSRDLNSSKESCTSSKSNLSNSETLNQQCTFRFIDSDKETYKIVKQEDKYHCNQQCSQFIDESTVRFPEKETHNNFNFNASLFLNMSVQQNRSPLLQEYGIIAMNTSSQQYPSQQQQCSSFLQSNQQVMLESEEISNSQHQQKQQKKQQQPTNERQPIKFFNELVQQDTNLEKVCGYLSNLEQAQQQLLNRIDSIRNKLLTQIELEFDDFTYKILGEALRSNEQVEEKIQRYFMKLRKTQSNLATNTVLLNSTYQSRLEQIEEELDRLLGASIVPQDQGAGDSAEILDSSGQKIIPENESIELWEYYQISPIQELEEAKKCVELNCRYVIEFDGCAKGNPGRASAGFLIRSSSDENLIIIQHNLLIGNKTVNQAEYLALVYALHVAHSLGIRHLTILSDSEVIIKQMQKIHQVRSLQLKDYYRLANLMLQYFFSIHFTQIQKRQNMRADALAASAL